MFGLLSSDTGEGMTAWSGGQNIKKVKQKQKQGEKGEILKCKIYYC